MERLVAHLIALLALAGGQEKQSESPRALIERAAYVEEHERDFQQAAALYQQAEAAARTAGDAATAREAAAGKQRAEARRDGAPARSDPAQEAAIDDRVGDLLVKLAQFSPLIGSQDERWTTFKALQDDLQVYGSAAAPRLESLLEPRMIDVGEYRVAMDTRMAARLLAGLEVDAAAEALGRGLQSQDPLIRRSIAGALNQTRHRALLEQAARDVVSQVRSVAIARLLLLADPSLQPLAEEQVRQGDAAAGQWLAIHDPERLLEVMSEEGSKARFSGLQHLERSQLPMTEQNADRLLRLAREGGDPSQRDEALETLCKLFDRFWVKAPRELRLLVQARLLAEPERYPEVQADYLLGMVGDIRAFEYSSRRWAAEPEGSDERKRLADICAKLSRNLRVEDFADLARLYREIPARDEKSFWHEQVAGRLAELSSHVSMSVLLAGSEGLEGVLRTNYLWSVRNWLEGQPIMQSTTVVPGTLDPALIPLLREMLAAPERGHHESAMAGLGRAGDLDSVPRIIAVAFRTDGSSSIRGQVALRALVQHDVDKAAREITAAIERGEITPRAIKHIDDTGRALGLFKECWSRNQDQAIRGELLAVLIDDLRGPEADAVILEHWDDISHPRSRSRAITRFGENLYEPAIPTLGLALEDPNTGVRQVAREAFRAFKEQREALAEFAAWTLGDREARAQIQDLIGLLASPDRTVVIGAVKALGAVRGRAALPALVRLLERKDPELEKAILAAIDAIGQ